MIPKDRASWLARVDGLSSELLRLSLYCRQHLDAGEALDFQQALRPLLQWCAHMHNDVEND